MDFARKQLEKYGWSDGKGLGKNEDGISQALKTKMKRSVAGLGHDAAADFTEHWWTTLYDKAAGNVKVEDKNGKTKKIKTESDNFEITNSEWKLKRKKNKEKQEPEEEYSSFFIKKAILSNGGAKTVNAGIADSDSDEEIAEKKDILKLTDEELFAACGGRTAHKGARHGLRAEGKLARIEEQEKLLLQESRFNGYSHKKTNKQKLDMQQIEDMNLNSDGDIKQIKSKKKKKKHCSREIVEAETEKALASEKEIKNNGLLKRNDNEEVDNLVEREDNVKKKKKRKKIKVEEQEQSNCIENIAENICETEDKVPRKKKKKKGF